MLVLRGRNMRSAWANPLVLLKMSIFLDEQGRPYQYSIAPAPRALPEPFPKVAEKPSGPMPALKPPTPTYAPKPASKLLTPISTVDLAAAAMPEVDLAAIPLSKKSHGSRAAKKEREQARRGVSKEL